MADYSRHEVVTRHIEYRVPVWADHGAPIGEVYDAINAARREVIASGGEKATEYDDWCRVVPGDEHVIIRIEVKETAK